MSRNSADRAWWYPLSVVIACAAGLMLVTGCERYTPPALAYNESTVQELRELLKASAKEKEGAASAAEPTGWATLKGRFTLTGAAPPRVPLTVDKDAAVCAPGGKVPLSETVVVGPNNGFQNVLIYLTTPLPVDNPKWEHPSYTETKTAEVIFDQKNCVFLSHLAGMRATQTLKVLNSDPVGHNTNLDSKRGARSANMLIAAGASQLYRPENPSPSPFPVSCSIHPWMTAWMMVCDSGYFAITKPDGSFEIPNLPAGVPLEFRAWQEKATYLQNVTMNGEATKWNRGRFILTLNADEVREVNVSMDAAVVK